MWWFLQRKLKVQKDRIKGRWALIFSRPHTISLEIQMFFVANWTSNQAFRQLNWNNLRKMRNLRWTRWSFGKLNPGEKTVGPGPWCVALRIPIVLVNHQPCYPRIIWCNKPPHRGHWAHSKDENPHNMTKKMWRRSLIRNLLSAWKKRGQGEYVNTRPCPGMVQKHHGVLHSVQQSLFLINYYSTKKEHPLLFEFNETTIKWINKITQNAENKGTESSVHP